MRRALTFLCLLLLPLPTRADVSTSDPATSEAAIDALVRLLDQEHIVWLRVASGPACDHQEEEESALLAAKLDGGGRLVCAARGATVRCRPWRASFSSAELCGDAGWSVPPPPGIDALARLTHGLEIAPVDDGDGLRVTDRSDLFAPRVWILVRGGGRWRALELDGLGELGESFGRGPWRVLDATRVTGRPLWAVTASIYSGGSQSGGLGTKLFLVEPAPEGRGGGLRLVTSKTIGTFGWAITPEERSRLIQRGVYQQLRARPHYELLLEPVARAGALELRRKRVALGRLSYFCEPAELSSGKADDDTICPVEELREVQEAIGRWRVVGGELRR